MTKQEFFMKLRETLSDELNDRQVNEQVQYYECYINEQIRLGRSESEVLDELGDPRSIAHNIIDGIEAGGSNAGYSVYEEYTENGENAGQTEPTWKAKFKVYGTMAVILCIIFVVLMLVTRLIIWLLPAIVVAGAILWIIKKINGQ